MTSENINLIEDFGGFYIWPTRLLAHELKIRAQQNVYVPDLNRLQKLIEGLAVYTKPSILTNHCTLKQLKEIIPRSNLSFTEYPYYIIDIVDSAILSAVERERNQAYFKKHGDYLDYRFLKDVNENHALREKLFLNDIDAGAKKLKSINGLGIFETKYVTNQMCLQEVANHEYGLEEFRLAFAFTIRQMKKGSLRGFLNNRLEKDFDEDMAAFVSFLKDILDEFNMPGFFSAHTLNVLGEYIGNLYVVNSDLQLEKSTKLTEVNKPVNYIEDCYMTTSLTTKQRNKIGTYLQQKQIVRNGESFANYLNGDNKKFHLYNGKIYSFYKVIQLLYRVQKVIKLSGGKHFLQHVFYHAIDSSINLNKSTPAQYLDNLRKSKGYNSQQFDDLLEGVKNIIASD